MPTNRVTKGDSLNRILLQPGWSIENDGFGLLTCSATYIVSHGNDAGTQAGSGSYALGAAPKRGDVFEKDARLKCHRSSSSLNSNGLQVISAEFIGIESGNMTTPQVSGRGATTTEPIATHPVFKSLIGGTKTDPKNGAEFEDDGAFKRFADPNIRKYGVRSYYSPTFSISGHFYTSDIEVPKKLLDAQCTVSADGKFPHGNGLKLVGVLSAFAPNPSWVGLSWSAPDESPQLLLTGMSIEDFGGLFKVSYDILVSTDGFDKEIYPYGKRPKRDNT